MRRERCSVVHAARHWRLGKRWAPYLFVSPFFVLFAILGLYPLLFSAYVSFFRWDGVGEMHWEGLGNYVYALYLEDLPWSRVLSSDFWLDLYERDFWRALGNTLWIGIAASLPQHLVAIPLAWCLHTRLNKTRNAVLGMYFLPFITNSVAIVLVFQAMFSSQYGLVNAVLTGIGQWQVAGVQPLGWLFPTDLVDWDRPDKTKWIVAFVVWWRYVGWNTVLYLAAIQTIPKDLLEAARVDGATRWQQLLHVVMPQLRPMIFFAVTLSLIGSLQLFEEPYVLTNFRGGEVPGGVIQEAETSAMYLLKVALNDGDFGTASAIAWLLFLFVAALTALNNRVLKPKD